MAHINAFTRLLFFFLTLKVNAQYECEKCSYEGHCFDRLVEMQVKMQKMEEHMLKLETSTDELREDFSALNTSLGKVVSPIVAFSVYNAVDSNAERGRIITFRHVLLNVAGGYDRTFGIFTAPVKGLYQFTAHLCQVVSKYVIFSIYQEGTELAVSAVYSSDAYTCGSVTAVTMLELGHRVTLQGSYDSNRLLEDIYRRGSFVGMLVHV